LDANCSLRQGARCGREGPQAGLFHQRLLTLVGETGSLSVVGAAGMDRCTLGSARPSLERLRALPLDKKKGIGAKGPNLNLQGKKKKKSGCHTLFHWQGKTKLSGGKNQCNLPGYPE